MIKHFPLMFLFFLMWKSFNTPWNELFEHQKVHMRYWDKGFNFFVGYFVSWFRVLLKFFLVISFFVKWFIFVWKLLDCVSCVLVCYIRLIFIGFILTCALLFKILFEQTFAMFENVIESFSLLALDWKHCPIIQQ